MNDILTTTATVVVAASAVAGGWWSWDRTTIGDVERWDAIREAGGRVPVGERLRARICGIPVPPVVPQAVAPVEPGDALPVPRTGVSEVTLRRLAADLDAAGYDTERPFVESVSRALVAAGPVPAIGAGLRGWVDTLTSVMLAAGYRVRLDDAETLAQISTGLHSVSIAGGAR